MKISDVNQAIERNSHLRLETKSFRDERLPAQVRRDSINQSINSRLW